MEKKSWDDIPSLEGLDMDWDYTPATTSDKRAAIRLPSQSLVRLFEAKEILARLAAEGQTYTVRILDLSEGGMCVALPVVLTTDLMVTVGFFLGQRKVITKARICHVRKDESRYVTGLTFLHLDKETAAFIRGLYASQVLSRTL